MTPILFYHFSLFGLVISVLKSLLGIARQWSREKLAIFTLSLGVMREFCTSNVLCWLSVTSLPKSRTALTLLLWANFVGHVLRR